MKRMFLALALLLNAIVYGQNGLECIVVEKYYVSDANDTTVNDDGGRLPVGSTTYRIYADMLTGYTFQAAYGVDVAPTGSVSPGDHELRIETTTLFFNNQDRGSTSPDFTKARCADNTVMLDSWLSVGAACANNFGIMKSKDDATANVVNGDGVLQNADTAAGIPLTSRDGLIAGAPQAITAVGIASEILVFDNQNDGTNGPLFSTSNGSWACLGGSKGPDTLDNKVLIAQITTDGILTFQLNLQIGTPSGGVEKYVAKNPVGAEIMLPCLTDTFGRKVTVTVPPTTAITYPADDDTLNVAQAVTITANAASTTGTIAGVEFFVNGTSIGTDNSSPYTYSWTPATTGHYNLTVKATDNVNAVNTSTVVGVTVVDPNGVDELNASNPFFSVSPVPAKDVVRMKIAVMAQTGNASYSIYDVVGKELMHKELGVVSNGRDEAIDISALASGQYFVALTINGFTSTQRIAKN